jgi:hypothetical protein
MKLDYTISDDYILNVNIGDNHHGGKYFCGKFDSKEEAKNFYKDIETNKNKNICFETDKEGFELLSFIGLNGKYKESEDKYFICLGKYPLSIKSKGYISVGQLSKIIYLNNFELSSDTKRFDKNFVAYQPNSIFEKTNYSIEINKIISNI